MVWTGLPAGKGCLQQRRAEAGCGCGLTNASLSMSGGKKKKKKEKEREKENLSAFTQPVYVCMVQML